MSRGQEDHPRPGRPSQFDEKAPKELDEALSKSPQDYGLSRNRWDGVVVAEHLKGCPDTCRLGATCPGSIQSGGRGPELDEITENIRIPSE